MKHPIWGTYPIWTVVLFPHLTKTKIAYLHADNLEVNEKTNKLEGLCLFDWKCDIYIPVI